MWRAEVRRVVISSYPSEFTSNAVTRKTALRTLPRWLGEPTVLAAMIGLAGTILTVLVTVWLSKRSDEQSPPRVPERVVVEIVPGKGERLPVAQIDPPKQKAEIVPRKFESSSPRRADDPKTKDYSPVLTLDGILDALERHHQRATFGAVAAILGRDQRSLFKGYVRTPKTGWVVNKATGRPTGSNPEEIPDGLLEKERVINSAEELRVWLSENR